MKGTQVLLILVKLLVLSTPALSAAVAEHHHGTQSTSTTTTTTTTTTTVIHSEAVTTYLEKNFRAVKSASNSKSKNNESRNKLKKALQELIDSKSNFFKEIIEVKEYFQHFVKIFKYKGEQTEEALKKFLYEKTVTKGKIRKFGLVMKQICKNNAHPEKKPLPAYARKFYPWYAVRTFAPWVESTDGSHFVRARLNKCLYMEAEDSVYLLKVMQNETYAKYLAQVTGFTGDYRHTESFKEHIAQLVQKEPRLVACGIKYIALNQYKSTYSLVVSKQAQTILDRIKSGQPKPKIVRRKVEYVSIAESFTSKTVKTKITSYLNEHFGKVKSDSENHHATFTSIQQFRSEHRDWIISILQEEQYYNFVKDCIGYQEKEHIQNRAEALAEYWFNNFYTSETTSIYTSVILKTIYRHTTTRTTTTLTRESSRYIKTHYEKYVTHSSTTTTTSTHHQQTTHQQAQQQQHHQQQQHQHQQTTTTVSKFQSQKTEIVGYLASTFGKAKSDSENHDSILRQITEIKDSHKNYLYAILEEPVYYNFVKECLGWKEKQGVTNQVEELVNHWINTYYKRETCIYTSIILKTIYRHSTRTITTLTRESSRYIKTHYEKYVSHSSTTTTTSTHHQAQQQQHQHQQTTTTVSKFQSQKTEIVGYLATTFGKAKSDSENHDSILRQITEIKDSHKNYLYAILEEPVYYNFVKECLGWKEKQGVTNQVEELVNHWINTYYKRETCIYTSIILKTIYRHSINQVSSLSIKSSRYISGHYQKYIHTSTTTHQTSVQHTEQHHQQQQVTQTQKVEYVKRESVVKAEEIVTQQHHMPSISGLLHKFHETYHKIGLKLKSKMKSNDLSEKCINHLKTIHQNHEYTQSITAISQNVVIRHTVLKGMGYPCESFNAVSSHECSEESFHRLVQGLYHDPHKFRKFMLIVKNCPGVIAGTYHVKETWTQQLHTFTQTTVTHEEHHTSTAVTSTEVHG